MGVLGKKTWKRFFKKKRTANYDQNDGVPGVVYILANSGLASNFYKIGCSRHSGDKRADDFNRDANTGTPAQYKCIFQTRTIDCGLAEKRVFERLKSYRVRTTKLGQEFFNLSFAIARRAVAEECEKVDEEYKNKEEAKNKKSAILVIKPINPRRIAGRYAALKGLGNVAISKE